MEERMREGRKEEAGGKGTNEREGRRNKRWCRNKRNEKGNLTMKEIRGLEEGTETMGRSGGRMIAIFMCHICTVGLG